MIDFMMREEGHMGTKFRSMLMVVLLSLALVVSGEAQAAPDSEALLREIASREGIAVENLKIVYVARFKAPLTGKAYHYYKVLDERTGYSFDAATDDAGRAVDHKAMKAEENDARRAAFGKIHPSLHRALQDLGPEQKVKVSIWLKMEEVPGEGDRPTPAEARALGKEGMKALMEERRMRAKALHEAVQAPLLRLLRQGGVEASEARGSEISPMVVAEMPRALVEGVAKLPYVDTIDIVVQGGPEAAIEKTISRPGGPEGGPEAASARQTVKADVVEGRGITGSEVKLAVIEGDGVSDTNPYLNNATHAVSYFNSTTKGIDDHATACAGFMSSTHDTVRGVAPSASAILSGNAGGWTLTDLQPAVTWALGQGAHALNNSYYLETDGVMHNSDRWADYIVRNNAKVFVKSAGNRGEDEGNVTSPGLGYNVITVGAIDDFNNSNWTDDRMASLSSYAEPAGRNKPEVVAVGCAQWSPGQPTTGMESTTRFNPWTGDVGCGTSYAAPAVTGMVASLINRAPSWLYGWPEAVKAAIIATALHNIEGVSRLSEYDGAGAIDMGAADTLVANGWLTARSVNGNSFDIDGNITYDIGTLYAGERFRAALAYDSNPAGDYSSDPLEGDLDLYLVDAAGTVVASATGVDSWEIIDWNVTATGNYRLRVRNFGSTLAPTESTYIGVAWWPGHYVLEDTAVQTRNTPTSASDDYRLDVTEARWHAVAMRSPAGADYDMDLRNNSRYGNPADFTWLEDSTTTSPVDIVLIDGNHAPLKAYYPIVNAFSGTGNYDIQRAVQGGDLYPGAFTWTTTPKFIATVWDIPMTAGTRMYFGLKPSSGDANLGMLLMDSNPATSATFYQGRSTRAAESDSAGAGGSEFMNYMPSASDRLGLVVYNNQGQTVATTWTLYVDDSPPTGSVAINGGNAYCTSTSVTLNLSAADAQTGVSEMSFSNNGTTFSAWEPYATSRSWALASVNGAKTVYVRYRNNANMESTAYSDTIVHDSTVPTGSVTINGGAAYTDSLSVTLTLSAADTTSDVVSTRFSANGTTWSAWEPYATSRSWTLTSGSGTKTVYVQFMDAAGNISIVSSDAITFTGGMFYVIPNKSGGAAVIYLSD
jgi:hypothetical protein